MRKAARLLAGLLVLLIVAGCGETPQAQVEEEVAPGGVVTLRIVQQFSGDGLDAVISAFDQRYPNIRIEQLPMSQQDWSNEHFVASKIADRAADIVQVSEFNLVPDHLLLPLDAYLQKSGYDPKPLGALLPAVRYAGKLYELPTMVVPEVLMYHPAMLAEAGITLPAQGMTWDDLRRIAARLTKSGRYGFAALYPESLVGSYLQQKNGGAAVWQQQVNPQYLTEALNFFSTLVFTDKSMPVADKRESTRRPGPGPVDLFAMGRAAMTIDSWNRQGFRFQNTPFKPEVAPLPVQLGVNGHPLAGYTTYGIAGNTRKPDAAWQFLSFLAGPEGQSVLAREGFFPAYRTPETRQAWFSQATPPPQGTAAFFESDWLVGPRNTAPAKEPLDFEQLQARHFSIPANEVLSGQKPVAAAVADWDRLWHQK